MKSRREALKIIGAVGVTCAFPFSANELYGQHVHPTGEAAAQEAKPGAPFAPQFFTPAQLLVISRLTDLIIPPTDTPGAAAAGVPAIYRSGGERRSEAAGHLSRRLTPLRHNERIQVCHQRLSAVDGSAAGRNPYFAQ